jgi:starvation-inducible outer membrane lipoprotein
MKTLILILALTLVGCATPPKWLAAHYNNQDPCQRDPYLQYCGASNGRAIIYDINNARIGHIQK